MYEIGQYVWVKSHERRGKVVERGYIQFGKSRKMSYLIEFADPHGDYDDEYLCGSANLRAADGYCDGCGRWLPHSSFVAHSRRRGHGVL